MFAGANNVAATSCDKVVDAEANMTFAATRMLMLMLILADLIVDADADVVILLTQTLMAMNRSGSLTRPQLVTCYMALAFTVWLLQMRRLLLVALMPLKIMQSLLQSVADTRCCSASAAAHIAAAAALMSLLQAGPVVMVLCGSIHWCHLLQIQLAFCY